MKYLIAIDNPSCYKKCRSKQYDCYISIPPKGTLIGNKLMYPIVEQLLNGKCYMPAYVARMLANHKEMYSIVEIFI